MEGRRRVGKRGRWLMCDIDTMYGGPGDWGCWFMTFEQGKQGKQGKKALEKARGEKEQKKKDNEE